MHFPTDLKIQMFPISKPNTHSTNLSLLPLRLWPRIELLQLQCWLRLKLLLHWHSQSRSGLSLFPLNWLYIGNWGKAKPWNCTTRFAHIVHDTIWQWYAGGFSHPSGSQGRLLNMPQHDSVSVWVHQCVWVKIHLWKSKILASSLFSLPGDSSRTKPNADSALRRQSEN